MDDRPQDRAEDRRRRGPLGDEDAEETQRVSQGGEDATTRQLSPEDAEREATARTPDSERTSRRAPDEEDPETRLIRTPGAHADEAALYPGGYMEAAEVREARLREIYGGVDYLASFIGSVFALICISILLSISGLVLVPLGFTLNLEGRQIDAAIIIGLAVIGLILFLAYFCGGYVAGRLARFDGGRNGMATVAWGILLSAILLLFGSLLPGPIFQNLLQEFAQTSVLPAISSLSQIGPTGAGIAVGALVLALLGGFLGGRLGNSYHIRIDHTT